MYAIRRSIQSRMQYTKCSMLVASTQQYYATFSKLKNLNESFEGDLAFFFCELLLCASDCYARMHNASMLRNKIQRSQRHFECRMWGMMGVIDGGNCFPNKCCSILSF